MDCKFLNELGTVTMNDEVVRKVAGFAALECYGIVGMAAKRTTDDIVQMLGLDNIGRGVIVRIDGENRAEVDLYIVVEYGISISAVAETLIDTVKYKVEYLTGVKVKNVNVTVEDIRV
ncbi:MAG: Asp23/Gls24 family envelope stress response protein [Clostridia bacterium]|nr:Asp23/Gls24 family envelope stress response protein [Clostridia bacterium]